MQLSLNQAFWIVTLLWLDIILILINGIFIWATISTNRIGDKDLLGDKKPMKKIEGRNVDNVTGADELRQVK